MSTINGIWLSSISLLNNSSTESPHSPDHISETSISNLDQWSIPFKAILGFLCIVIMILAIGGNAMVLATILRHQGMRTRTNMFIASLAIGDLLTAVLVMPFSLITIIAGTWKLNKVLCNFNGFTMALFIFTSIHLLMYISVHKYISITKPFSRFMTKRRILYMIAAAWFWACVISIGPMVGWNRISYKLGASQCGPNYPLNILELTHSAFVTITGFLIPFGVMTRCYYGIFKEIKEHMVRMRDTTNIDHDDSLNQQRRITVTLVIVLVCFLMCWTPYIIYSCWSATIWDKSRVPNWVNPVAYWCGFVNSACNPIIYAFRSPSFRQGYQEIMCGKSDYPQSIGDDTIGEHSPTALRRFWTYIGRGHGSRNSIGNGSQRNSVSSLGRSHIMPPIHKYPAIPPSPHQLRNSPSKLTVNQMKKIIQTNGRLANKNVTKSLIKNGNIPEQEGSDSKLLSLESLVETNPPFVASDKIVKGDSFASDADSADEIFYSVDETKDDPDRNNDENVDRIKCDIKFKPIPSPLKLLQYTPSNKYPLLAQASVDVLDVPKFLYRKGKSETFLDSAGIEKLEKFSKQKSRSEEWN